MWAAVQGGGGACARTPHSRASPRLRVGAGSRPTPPPLTRALVQVHLRLLQHNVADAPANAGDRSHRILNLCTRGEEAGAAAGGGDAAGGDAHAVIGGGGSCAGACARTHSCGRPRSCSGCAKCTGKRGSAGTPTAQGEEEEEGAQGAGERTGLVAPGAHTASTRFRALLGSSRRRCTPSSGSAGAARGLRTRQLQRRSCCARRWRALASPHTVAKGCCIEKLAHAEPPH